MNFNFSEDFFDCVNEGGTLIEDPTTVSVTTTTRTRTTVNIGRTSSPPRTHQTTNKPENDLNSEVESSKVEVEGESAVIRGVAIGFAGIALIAIAGFSFAFYRKTRINRFEI